MSKALSHAARAFRAETTGMYVGGTSAQLDLINERLHSLSKGGYRLEIEQRDFFPSGNHVAHPGFNVKVQHHTTQGWKNTLDFRVTFKQAEAGVMVQFTDQASPRRRRFRSEEFVLDNSNRVNVFAARVVASGLPQAMATNLLHGLGMPMFRPVPRFIEPAPPSQPAKKAKKPHAAAALRFP